MQLEAARPIIELSFPGLHVDSIEFIGEGSYSRAFEVNPEYVFRFPMSAVAAKQLDVEIALLPRLQDSVSAQIPQFEYIGTQPDRGFSFVGYKKIGGVPLGRKLLEGLEEGPRRGATKELAEFLQQIHSFPVTAAKRLGVMVSDERKYYAAELERARAQVYPMIGEPVQRYVEGLFREYLDSDENFVYTPTLLHADLGSSHILYDQDRQRLAGVIDFGDVRIGDPVYDLMYLYEGYGQGFIDSFLGYFDHGHMDRLRPKLQFFMESNTVLDVLYWGLEKGDDVDMRRSLSRLERQAGI